MFVMMITTGEWELFLGFGSVVTAFFVSTNKSGKELYEYNFWNFIELTIKLLKNII